MKKNLKCLLLLSFFLISDIKCGFRKDALYAVLGLGVFGISRQILKRMDSRRARNQTRTSGEIIGFSSSSGESNQSRMTANLDAQTNGSMQRQAEIIEALNENIRELPGILQGQLGDHFSPTNRTIFWSLTVFAVTQICGFSVARLMDRLTGKTGTFSDWSKLGVGSAVGVLGSAIIYKIFVTKNKNILQTNFSRAGWGEGEPLLVNQEETMVTGTGATNTRREQIGRGRMVHRDENGNQVNMGETAQENELFELIRESRELDERFERSQGN